MMANPLKDKLVIDLSDLADDDPLKELILRQNDGDEFDLPPLKVSRDNVTNDIATLSLFKDEAGETEPPAAGEESETEPAGPVKQWTKKQSKMKGPKGGMNGEMGGMGGASMM